MTLDKLKQSSNKTVSRRNFFKIVSGVFTGFIAVTLGIPMLESLVGTISKKKNQVFSKIAPINSIPTEKPVNLPFVMTVEDAFIKNIQPENVWAVKNSNSETTVFSPICPHLGCRYQWHENQKLFICPCHHSVFNMDGKVVSGPAPRPLDTLPIKVKNNYLYALWERFKPGIPQKEII
jgi:menaquinol-cytochrome c reductase iron-sulfur subunit